MYTFHKSINAIWNAVSSGIWTRVSVIISFDDNHYTKNASYTLIVYENNNNMVQENWK